MAHCALRQSGGYTWIVDDVLKGKAWYKSSAADTTVSFLSAFAKGVVHGAEQYMSAVLEFRDLFPNIKSS
jgi:hypothetical protein